MNYFNELFDDTNGVCHQVFSISEDRAKALFGDIDNNEKSVIDGFFNFMIGEKLLAPAVIKVIKNSADVSTARATITKYFLIRYETSLNNLKASLNIKYNPLENDTTTIDSKTINNSKNENVNTIAGYDSDTMVDSDGEKGKNHSFNKNKSVMTKNGTGRSATDLIKEKLNADKNNIYYNCMLDDIKEFFTLDVY